MRFRLFRSRAFWFGVPGLVFLLWGWWLATGHRSWAGFEGARPWGVGQSGGEVYVVWDSGGGPEWRSFDWWQQKSAADEVAEMKRLLAENEEMFPANRYGFIPCYWLVAGYVAGWAGLIFWRSRKYRAFAKAE